MTNQERSIFHGNGMPLRFSDNARAGRGPSLAWMSPFSIGQPAQPMLHNAGVFPSPALDAPIDEGEQPPAFQTQERTVIPEKASNPAADEIAQPDKATQLMSPSFSWPVGPDSPVGAPSKQGEAAVTLDRGSDQMAGQRQRERSLGSMPADLPQPERRLHGLKIVPKAGSTEGPSGLSVFARETVTGNETRTNTVGVEPAARSTGSSLGEHTEDGRDRQNLGMNVVTSPRLGRVESKIGSAPAVKVTASRRTIDPERASPPRVIADNSWTANTFLPQKLHAELLTPTVAPKSDAIEVLEKLSFGASPTPAAPRPGRQVHIGKLHITVQRPAVAAPQQQPSPVAEAQHASQTPRHAFLNPWERHYSSFD